MFKCNVCAATYTRSDNLTRHLKKGKHSASSRAPPVKKIKYCDCCDSEYTHNHFRSTIHKNNSTNNYSDDIQIINSAFKCRIISYKINNTHEDLLTPEEFLIEVKDKVFNLLCEKFEQFITIKFNIELFGNYILNDVIEIKSFNTKNYVFTYTNSFNDVYEEIIEKLKIKSEQFQERDSGWSLINITHLELNINKYNPLRGNKYSQLPNFIMKKHACINIQNDDDACFYWAVVSALYPAEINSNRVSSYPHFMNVLNLNDVKVPMYFKDIHKFEVNNNLSINVYGIENESIVGPLYYSKNKKETHINLLYVEDEHFCLIKSLSRLISTQISKHKSKVFICDGCLLYFNNQLKLDIHQKDDCNKIITKFPKAGSYISFQNYPKKLKVPFVIYADFECLLKPISNCQPNPTSSFSTLIQKHVPFSFAYYIKCEFDTKLSKYVTYRGIDCAKIFIQRLTADCIDINLKLSKIIPMIPLSDDDNILYQSNICHICEKAFKPFETKVRDHCHLSGKFRGPAHNVCNLNFQTCDFIPIFFHNLTGYDSHLFIKELADGGSIDIIPINKESYISITKTIKLDNNQSLKLRFLDSYRFMSSSIEKLAHNLKSSEFTEMAKYFTDVTSFNLMIRKNVFPYDYITDLAKLQETALPSKELFFNRLTNSNVSDVDYNHALNVWSHFQINSLGEYSDIYLKSDVLLLADIFENFRKICLNTYGLDPAQYYTAPGLSWDAMLKFTQIKLDYLHDIDMIHFFKRGIRGGINQCNHRYSEANNKYMNNYDHNQESKYLFYLDANNLYGWAMSQYLPSGDFQWLPENEVQIFNLKDYNEPSDTGYILEVDLKYPQNLHDTHNDLPFCPENIISDIAKVPKLITNLYDKSKYIIHYLNLKQCIDNGLILTKIHRVLKFKQSPWLKKYIDLNTDLRKIATTDFEKDFFKLMNNSVYGKTMENIEKRVNVILINNWEMIKNKFGAEKYISKPNFHSCSIFNENLVAIQMNRTSLYYNKPTYLGFCVLDLSKKLMYDFHYSYMMNKFNILHLKMLYTDTDSLIYEVKTEDLYEDIKSDINEKFDTSNFLEKNQYNIPLINKKVLGLMKDENGGKIMKSFVGLRSKLYAITVDNQLTAKAKGINYSVVKTLCMNDYRKCIDGTQQVFKDMIRFRSIKHVIFSQIVNKIAICGKDDKRFIMENSINTYAWGHYKIGY